MRPVSGKFRAAVIAVAFAVVGLAQTAFAATAYSDAAFQAAQASGAPVLVRIEAGWCSVCKTQTPIINDLATQAKFKNLKIFTVDFDSQKTEVRKFGAQMQSTLIVFKGKSEVGRSVGDTKRDSITTLLDKGL